MTAPNFGYQSTRPSDDVITVVGRDFSKAGFCSTSKDADASVFPVNVARRFTSTDPAFLSKLGTGELAAAVAGLNDQLGGDGADLTVVRVAEGTDENPEQALRETMANIVGSAGDRSGLWALRNAPATVKAALHLIGVPGYTWQEPDAGADNPIRAALAPHLEAMKAISIVDVDPTDMIKAIASREKMSSDRMMPLGVAAMVEEKVGSALQLVQRAMSSRVLGLIIATDNNYREGMPFDSFANKPILGIADVNRSVSFLLDDGSTEGQQMLAADVAIVAEGSSAVTGSIAAGGFTFVGVESAATSDLWSQIHQVRGADFIDAEMLDVTKYYLGGRITPRRAEAWLSALKGLLLDHVGNEDILGFLLEFPQVINSLNDVAEGQLSIRTHAEPAPIFRRAINEIRRYRPAVDALVAAIAARAGTSSAVVS